MATTTAPANQTTYTLMVDLSFAPAAIYDQNLKPLDSYLSGVEILDGAFAIPAGGEALLTYADSGATNHCFSALHTPDLSANLISIGKFDDLEFSMVFKGRQASFVDPSGRTFMTGEKKNQMYRLDLTPVSSLNPALKLTSTKTLSDTGAMATKVLVTTSLDKPVLLDIWH
ncbi:hypothetical protein C0995_005387 [Termitomyces sp. Mi166|nr:hypothetical protein C0995_005387 [Termitomyces sp. Mi166\